MTRAARTTVRLNNAVDMPLIGYGTWQVTAESIAAAARAGYVAFDSATYYKTEAAVTEGVRAAGLAVEDMFLTTKVWRKDMGYESTLAAFEQSRRAFDVDTIDLYLIHWPQPQASLMIDTWRAFEHLLSQGKVRAIGVSNFGEDDLDLLARHCEITPAVNQIELSPLRPQHKLRAINDERGIVTAAWSPLGQGGPVLQNPTLRAIADELGVGTAQVILRWLWQKQIVSLPRSNNPDRIAQNIAIDGFELNSPTVNRIDGLGGRP